ncbi:membrane-bound lytic murein transglycosylase D [Hymenobacter daecheongensis DSM 21074]|uniref:Membrane-bound lytic murein transglycosylase D n=1 Tax=Hymenobacter daecheongensis DSM 21074 TaxID=1121955 RepID=A0A1M6LES8_9BACT|nr:lytic transglycosylase domain-containing protein [Hymenobacter daecheongensis]SHJ69648.1 membrane-bound lytic murein transglycosylase D [Hymenobacter daecheongensis DSM 21074]
MKRSLAQVAFLLLLAAGACPVAAQTQPELTTDPANDTTHVQLLPPPDSLAAAPLPTAADSARLVWLQTPPEVKDLVADRVNCFDTDVPHVFNNTVMSFVTYFTVRNRAYTQRILERQNLYFPLFEKYLAKYHLPQDLKYLAVVESALLPTARSRVGAVGLWQFMGPTAGDLRLVRNEYIDERMNPEKSTEAACRFLRDLYRQFGDWELVLAAYNWGSGNVQRAIKRNGTRNFWALYPSLPKETRNYVPTFTALLYTMQYANEHQLHSEGLNYQYPEPTDTLLISGRSLDLRKFAAQFGLDSSAILKQNPEICKTYLPASIRNYALTVPKCVSVEMAALDRTTVLDFCQVALPPPVPLAPLAPALPGTDSTGTQLAATETAAPEKVRLRRLRHTVRRGETVAAVAERYEVTPAQIRRWNELPRKKALVPRQQLVLFVPVETPEAAPTVAVAAARKPRIPAKLPLPAEKAAVTMNTPPKAAADSEAVAEPVVAKVLTTPRGLKAAREAAATATAANSAAPAVADDTLPATYTVRKGDYLTKIARERGLTVTQLMAWNKLSAETVVPGQKLLFAAPAETEAGALAQEVAPPPGKARRTAAPAPAVPQVSRPKTHLVQPGDTLYNISRRYQGVTVDQLRRLNNLKTDEVKPGQKLVIVQS